MPVTHRPRRSLSFRLVFAGLALSVLAVALIAAWAYVRYLRYERVAAQHLPPDTVAAVRVDVEQIVMFAPVRQHLLPLVDDLGAGHTFRTLQPRLGRIERETGVKLALELRELVLARGRTWSDWLLVVGGRFPKEGVIEGMQRVLQSEGLAWQLSADRQTLVAASGIALGQADDGALLLASSLAWLSRGLPASTTYQRLGLDAEGGGGFAADATIFHEVAASPAAFVNPTLRSLAAVTAARSKLTLGSVVDVETTIELRPGTDPARFAAELRTLFAALVAMSAFVPGSDLAGERRALTRARVEAAYPSRVVVRVPWPREDVERAAASLASAVRQWATRGAAAP